MVDRSLLPGGENFVGPLSPSELARTWQGSGAYPGVESNTNVTLPKGNYVVGSVPGQSPYYTTLDGFAGTNGTAQDFYQQLQIGPNLTNPAYPPYHSGVTIYQVMHSQLTSPSLKLLLNSCPRKPSQEKNVTAIEEIENALNLARVRLDAAPKFELSVSTVAQLEYVLSVMKGDENDRSRLKDIIVGHFAVREFEEGDPELAQALNAAQFIAFKAVKGLKV